MLALVLHGGSIFFKVKAFYLEPEAELHPWARNDGWIEEDGMLRKIHRYPFLSHFLLLIVTIRS